MIASSNTLRIIRLYRPQRRFPVISASLHAHHLSTTRAMSSEKPTDTADARPDYVGSKKKFALLFGYSGVGFKGLQHNPGIETVEKALHDAICKAGVIRESNQDDLHKVKWTRAARTDKGVHALGQVVGLKVLLAEGKEDAFMAAVNAALPRKVEVFDCIRVTSSFNAKFNCVKRRYEYWVPSYVFAPDVNRTESDPERTSWQQPPVEELKALREEKLAKNGRISPQTFALFQACLARYVGTHEFHNFTKKVAPNDPARKRVMFKVEADAPKVVDGVEIIRVRVFGQSFMLNQIRHMVGLAIEISRRGLSADLVDEAMSAPRFVVPRAPGEGLLLRACHFDTYNDRYCVAAEESDALVGKSCQTENGVDMKRRPIQFDHGRVKERQEDFCERVVLPTLLSEDKESFVFAAWLWNWSRRAFPQPIPEEQKTGWYSNYENYKGNKKQSRIIHKKETYGSYLPNDKPQQEQTAKKAKTE